MAKAKKSKKSRPAREGKLLPPATKLEGEPYATMFAELVAWSAKWGEATPLGGKLAEMFGKISAAFDAGYLFVDEKGNVRMEKVVATFGGGKSC